MKQTAVEKAFNNGAKWQQERSYSEKQMDDAYDKGFKDASERSYSEEDLKEAFFDGWVSREGDLPFTKAKNKWFKEFKKEIRCQI